MAKSKIDFVVEAVHYADDGRIGWVRGYERRGSTFSDRILLNRSELVSRILDKKVVVAGKRVPYLASSFETNGQLSLEKNNGGAILIAGEDKGNGDHLRGVPQI
jgi:hypothetical protein